MSRTLRRIEGPIPQGWFRCSAVVALVTVATFSHSPMSTALAPPEVVRVFAASSLSSVAPVLDSAFTDTFGNRTELNLAGSSQLATQISQGAPADVFISADEKTVRRLQESGNVGQSQIIATNSLALIVNRKTKGVTSLRSLSSPRVLVALGADGVPVGDYAREALAKARVRVSPATFESNVRSIITKVELGEVDAAIVYRTDAIDLKRVQRLAIPTKWNVVTKIVAAPVLTDGRPSTGGERYIGYLTEPAAKKILAKFRFGPAPRA